MTQYGAYKNIYESMDEENKSDLIVKIFEGLIAKIDITKEAINKMNYHTKYQELTKIITVIEMLERFVDMSYGDISKNLVNLYDYVERQLKIVHVDSDIAKLDVCREILKSLYEGFLSASNCKQAAVKNSKPFSTTHSKIQVHA